MYLRLAWSSLKSAGRNVGRAITASPSSVPIEDVLHHTEHDHPSAKCCGNDPCTPGCEWDRLKCDDCEGTGWCRPCGGEGVRPGGPRMTGAEFVAAMEGLISAESADEVLAHLEEGSS